MTVFLDKTASLTPAAYQVIGEQATERPNRGGYTEISAHGRYLCRRCGWALFTADSQFNAGCGWPSFDAEIAHAVRSLPDSDGQRIEIRCNRCDGHLGHVFTGEGFTANNKRYCVNSLALDFVVNDTVKDTEEAIVAGGCFWGVDYYLQKIPGVVKVEVGYTGGDVDNPTYEHVCSGRTGHYEAVRVIFDRAVTDYPTVLKRFFEIHDPTQSDGQGPDIGQRYQSAVFYYNQRQRIELDALIDELRDRGYPVVTQRCAAQVFWPAEDYHQHYYRKQSRAPVCHQPVLRFQRKG